ncbi:MAG: LysM peptidoglycan-binding domain-containing protein [Bacteroidales bacterium]|nr:LysM peptidoglycan-binding domain-containing protein [Bacteroidales bacterium]
MREKGETLYSITTKYNVSRKDIKKANKKLIPIILF